MGLSGGGEMSGSTESSNGDTLPDVCVVTHPLGAAGENATRTLLNILVEITGVSLITANLPSESKIRDHHDVIEITRKGSSGPVLVVAVQFILNQLQMCSAIRRRDEDIVLFFGATSYLVPILVSRLLGRTVLLEPRGNVPLTLRLSWERRMPDLLAAILAGLVRVLERVSFRAAHCVITYTPSMAVELGLNPDASNVYPKGARYVDTDRFAVCRGYSERENVIGFVGRLDEEKGVRVLAEVVKRLPEDIRMRFVGDGELRAWLEAEVASEIDAGRVQMTGWVDHDEIPAELNRLRLLVLPSQPTEGLPTTILEAFACGTPVLASPVSGVPDIVLHGKTGFHIESRTPAALRSSIEGILERDDIQRISQNGRRLIEDEYSLDAACTRYKRLLNRFR